MMEEICSLDLHPIYLEFIISLFMNRPRVLIWLLTSQCNLACRHCYTARFPRHGELNQEQALTVVRNAAEAGISHVALTGGEVFLRRDALEVIRQACKLGMITSVVSNGSMLDEEMARELANHGVFVYLSIDGTSKQTHEKIRGRGTWDSIASAVAAMQKFGLRFGTVMAVSNLNYGEVHGYLSLAKELGALVGCLIPVMPAGRAGMNIILKPEQMVHVLRDVDEAVAELDFPVSLWCIPFARLVVKSKRISAGFCRTSNDLDLDPQGNVLLCDVLDIAFANIKEKGILEAWQEQEEHPLVKSLTSPNLHEPCLTCPLKNKCRGGCFARAAIISGDIMAPDPLCPRVAGVL